MQTGHQIMHKMSVHVAASCCPDVLHVGLQGHYSKCGFADLLLSAVDHSQRGPGVQKFGITVLAPVHDECVEWASLGWLWAGRSCQKLTCFHLCMQTIVAHSDLPQLSIKLDSCCVCIPGKPWMPVHVRQVIWFIEHYT